jgi:hypothetical protein
LLNFVLVDSENGNYDIDLDTSGLEELGVEVIDCRLTGGKNATRYDDALLAEVLLSLT